jgi:uncharacterized protein YecE (DUF72 family)
VSRRNLKLESDKKLRIGCLSWSYPDWLGSFYPKGTKSNEFLRLYSKVFDIVEVDSTFYHSPRLSSIEEWKRKTPEGFRFTVKLSKKITHIAKLKDCARKFSEFENLVLPLKEKLGCIVVQLPPSLKFDSSVRDLREFLELSDSKVRFAIEFRHPSWLRQETYDLLKENNACLVWSENEYLETSDVGLTADFAYLRLRGEFNEFRRFNEIQKDKTSLIESSWQKIQKILANVKDCYILVSNHFEGFAPATANHFRTIAGLVPVNWSHIFASESVQMPDSG